MERINYVNTIIAPKANSFLTPNIMIIFFIVLFAGCIFMMFAIMHDMKNTKIIITNETLTIKSLFYGRTIPIEKINLNGLRNLNLENTHDYNIKIKINGAGFPNYYAGWMRLNNGNKALVHLTDRTNVILIPTSEYDILLSTDDFEGIKGALSRRN